MTDRTVLDLFAGIGGWDIALMERGYVACGVEMDKHALATRSAAGLFTMWDGDVRDLYVAPFKGQFEGIVGSPPCQAFSQASNTAKGLDDERGRLVYEPMRWIETGARWMCLEQVPKASQFFDNMARWLRERGWSAETKVVNAAQYGLPQARKRVLLAARADGEPIKWPPPVLADPSMWVTVAEALPHRTDLPDWCKYRPATTVVGSFRPEVLAAPGWRKPGDPPRQDTPDSPTVTIRERLVLQGFPEDWPVQGPKTAQGLQVGNAIPPTLARVALSAVGVLPACYTEKTTTPGGTT